MNTKSPFEAVCQAMSDPGFYPHAVVGPERLDTHISTVFLTGNHAYKLKKPVTYGFLDFRDLPDRRFFCRQEILLNRRLSDAVYQKVIPIYRGSGDRISLEPIGPVVEYAVCMRQLPGHVRLDELLRHHQVAHSDIERLGRRLAEFYRTSERSDQIASFGRPELIRINMEENFSQLEPFIKHTDNPQAWQFLCQVSRSFLNHNEHLFDRRIESGSICDGHGDLRTDHIYFDHGIQIIDCIEFNDRFRYGDLALDLAFLKMDFDYHHHADLGHDLIAAYVRESGDTGIYSVIGFYAAYRAVVRFKIACLQFATPAAGLHSRRMRPADRYLELAYRYAMQFSRPTLWICCGLPATGKSRLARSLVDTFQVAKLSTDAIRSDLYPGPRRRVVPYGTGIYNRSHRAGVYRRLLAEAQQILKKGGSVILDATFSEMRWREAAYQLARDWDANLIVAECTCGAKTIRKRLRMREQRPSVSDARLEHLPHLLNNYEPIDDCRPDTHIRVHTEQPRQPTLQRFLASAYAMQEKQVSDLLRGCIPDFTATSNPIMEQTGR